VSTRNPAAALAAPLLIGVHQPALDVPPRGLDRANSPTSARRRSASKSHSGPTVRPVHGRRTAGADAAVATPRAVRHREVPPECDGNSMPDQSAQPSRRISARPHWQIAEPTVLGEDDSAVGAERHRFCQSAEVSSDRGPGRIAMQEIGKRAGRLR
jgi:hypothetical protein